MIAVTETVDNVSRRVEAIRENAKRSTGPRSARGKIRVRLNALKHGLTAETLVLPGEDAEALKARVEAWKDDLKPQSPIEDYLVERAAHTSWQLDRADRALAARLTARVRFGAFERAEAETDEVEDLARRLFWDPRGPIALYPHFRGFRVSPRVSWPASVDDPLNPARIVNKLETTLTGCRWLIDRWTDLRGLLEQGLKWQAPDRLRAIRLMGRQPMDALADERVLSIYLACDAMEPTAPSSLDDLITETDDDELQQFKERVKGRGADWKTPKDPWEGQVALLALIDDSIKQVGLKLSSNRERQEFEAEADQNLLAFDDTPEGELMRRYRLAKGREFHRTLGTYFKVQREAEADANGDSRVASCMDGDVGGLAAPAAPIGSESIPVAGPGSAGWVQPIDASPGEPGGCAEVVPASPTLKQPEPDRIPVDGTQPDPTAGVGDETNPNPSEHPTPAAGNPTLLDYLARALAELDPSRRLPPTIQGSLEADRRPPTS